MNKILLISFCLTLCPYLLPLIYGQDIINPYIDKTGIPEEVNNNSVSYPFSYQTHFNQPTLAYDGEYEICLDNFFWWNSFPQYAMSYNFEIVSFPFTSDCLFTGGCGFNCSQGRQPNTWALDLVPSMAIVFPLIKSASLKNDTNNLNIFLSAFPFIFLKSAIL